MVWVPKLIHRNSEHDVASVFTEMQLSSASKNDNVTNRQRTTYILHILRNSLESCHLIVSKYYLFCFFQSVIFFVIHKSNDNSQTHTSSKPYIF